MSKMRYLGNKTRMIDNIDLFIRDLGITGKTFCDLFTGSASVADFFKDAFNFCNGVPEEIWFDNMKTVVDYHNPNNGEVTFNEKFLLFTNEFGYKPIACRPYRPQTKGIIENVAKVMDRLKVYNDELESLDDIIKRIKEFNIELNNEISQATNEKPISLFKKEKEYLKPVINQNILDTYKELQTRKVSKESMIEYKGNKYSLPTFYVGKIVEIDIKNLYI